MPFPPKQNHRIPLEAAAALTRRYRNEAKGGEIAQMFPREDLESLLSQAGAAGIRFYFGRASDGGPLGLVAVAVDKDGNDMTGSVLIDYGFPCPPFCSSTNPLNS
jgi:hypothetical protein